MTVWALPLSLAATDGIDVSFSSSGYSDVSFRRVPLRTLCVRVRIHGVPPCGFPHSEIRGSQDICSSPRLFAAYHVFLRLPVPRHPPCALLCFTSFWPYSVTAGTSRLRGTVPFFLVSRLSDLLSFFGCLSLFLFGSFGIRFSRYNSR